jgi:hypothetical protein
MLRLTRRHQVPFENVAAARHGSHDCPILIAYRTTNIGQALREGVVRYHCIPPDSIEQIPLADEFAAVFNEDAQHLERLRPQVRFVAIHQQLRAAQIERKPPDRAYPVAAILLQTCQWKLAVVRECSIDL